MTLSFVGCGKLGQTLGRLWATQRVFQIQQILTRSADSAQRAADFIGAGEAIDSYADLLPAEVYLIGTPDDQISNAAERLAASSLLRPGTIVFHCSGALASDVLKVLQAKDMLIASVHPIKSFADAKQAAQSFAGTWCGMEGDRDALAFLKTAFEAIEARLVAIRSEDKLIYHAAAVFASNYVVTLLDAALQAYVKAGIPEATARELIHPLVQGTLDSVVRIGPEQALTGPIARGDRETVRRQYEALAAWDKRSAQLYKQLGLHTAHLAARRK